MTKLIRFLLAILFCAGPVVVGCGPSLKEKLWRQAVTLEKKDDYQAYLDKFPEGRNARTAKEKIRYLDARQRHTPDAFRDFLTAYPESQNKKEILSLLEQIWVETQTAGSIDAYEAFISGDPFSGHTIEACNNLITLQKQRELDTFRTKWNKIKNLDDPDAVHLFLSQDPPALFLPAAHTAADLARLSKDIDLSRIRQGVSAYKKKQTAAEKEKRLVSVLFGLFWTDGPSYCVYKNEKSQYIKAIARAKEVMDHEDTHPLLKYTQPFEGMVLFLSNSHKPGFNQENFFKVFEDFSTINFFLDWCEFINVNPYKKQLITLLPEAITPGLILKKSKKSIIKMAAILEAKIHEALPMVPETRYVLPQNPVITDLEQKMAAEIKNTASFHLEQSLRTLLYINTHQGLNAIKTAGTHLIPYLVQIMVTSDPKTPRRETTLEMLLEMGTPVVDYAIDAMQNDRYRDQWSFYYLVRKLKSERTVPCLVHKLHRWDEGPTVTIVLRALGWHASTPADRVHGTVAERDRKALLENWEETRTVLLSDVRSNNKDRIVTAVNAFIALGKDEIISTLTNIVHLEGTRIMAETYLNCGHTSLAQAGKKWANDHGYSIRSGMGSHPVKWGRF